MDKVFCADCGADYSEMGLDITLPDEQWELISNGDNILCGSCIAKRGWKLPGAVAIRSRIEFSKDDPHFDFVLDDGRVAHLWRADRQEYQNATFDSGLVDGLPPEDIYLRLERDGTEHYFFFERDEAQSIAWLLNGALWSLMMQEKVETKSRQHN